MRGGQWRGRDQYQSGVGRGDQFCDAAQLRGRAERAATSHLCNEEGREGSADNNRRRCERLGLSLPVRVTGHDRRGGQWVEMAESLNVSRTGVKLRLQRRVHHGHVLHLMLPLPWQLRQHGHAKPSYQTYALVRRIEPSENGRCVVGLEFLGEYPPPRFIDQPWAVFRAAEWKGPSRRRLPREHRAEAVWLQYLTAGLGVVEQGSGRTENVSRGGARVCVQSPLAEFDLIKVTVVESGFESLAAVTNRYLGEDGFERLCLQLIGQEWPL